MQVPLGIILKNENNLAEMVDILKHLQVQHKKGVNIFMSVNMISAKHIVLIGMQH